jgi:hypothetical protein
MSNPENNAPSPDKQNQQPGTPAPGTTPDKQGDKTAPTSPAGPAKNV